MPGESGKTGLPDFWAHPWTPRPFKNNRPGTLAEKERGRSFIERKVPRGGETHLGGWHSNSPGGLSRKKEGSTKNRGSPGSPSDITKIFLAFGARGSVRALKPHSCWRGDHTFGLPQEKKKNSSVKKRPQKSYFNAPRIKTALLGTTRPDEVQRPSNFLGGWCNALLFSPQTKKKERPPLL